MDTAAATCEKQKQCGQLEQLSFCGRGRYVIDTSHLGAGIELQKVVWGKVD